MRHSSRRDPPSVIRPPPSSLRPLPGVRGVSVWLGMQRSRTCSSPVLSCSPVETCQFGGPMQLAISDHARSGRGGWRHARVSLPLVEQAGWGPAVSGRQSYPSRGEHKHYWAGMHNAHAGGAPSRDRGRTGSWRVMLLQMGPGGAFIIGHSAVCTTSLPNQTKTDMRWEW